jgi:hypothetical protein
MYAAVVAGSAIVADAVALCPALQIDLRELLQGADADDLRSLGL